MPPRARFPFSRARDERKTESKSAAVPLDGLLSR